MHPDAACAASAWIRRWSHLVPAGSTVLDLACGSGRHVRWFAQRACRVTGVDRDALAVAPLHGIADIVVADIETGLWPLAGRLFDAVVVTNYLWRERQPELLACLAPGGVLMFETFAVGNETIGKPSNPKFLLQPGELLQFCADLRVIAFEDGFEPTGPSTPERFVQRIVAARESPARTAAPTRFALLQNFEPGQLTSDAHKDSV